MSLFKNTNYHIYKEKMFCSFMINTCKAISFIKESV